MISFKIIKLIPVLFGGQLQDNTQTAWNAGLLYRLLRNCGLGMTPLLIDGPAV